MPMFRSSATYEARQLTKDNKLELQKWAGSAVVDRMQQGDWLVRSSDAHFMSMSNDAFVLRYDPVE